MTGPPLGPDLPSLGVLQHDRAGHRRSRDIPSGVRDRPSASGRPGARYGHTDRKPGQYRPGRRVSGWQQSGSGRPGCLWSAYGLALKRSAGDSPAGRPVSAVVAAGLLAFGVVAGIASLFPHYLGGSSLASVAADVVPHAIYLAAWTASAVLIWVGGSRRRVGALIGLGTSVVTLTYSSPT